MAERVGDVVGAVVQQLRPIDQPEPEDRSIEAWIAEQRRSYLGMADRWLEGVGVGLRLREVKIDPQLVPSECETWVRHHRSGAGMVLAGPVGSGKTIAAVHCLREVFALGEYHLPEEKLYEWRPARSCYVKARNLYRAVFERDAQTIERARNAAVLVIDEWGGAYESPWPLAEMDGLIDDRWEARRSTIITTNSHPTDGESSLKATAPRAFDRLCDAPGPGLVTMDRKSMRGEGGLQPLGEFTDVTEGVL